MTGYSNNADVKFRCHLRRTKDAHATGSEYSEPVEVYCYIRHATRTRAQRLSFNPIPQPPSRPSSRIRTYSRMRGANFPDSQTAASPRNVDDWNLPHPKHHRRGRGTRAAPQRLQPGSKSPDSNYNSTMAYRTKRATNSSNHSAMKIPRSNSTDAAAACFATGICHAGCYTSENSISRNVSIVENEADEYKPFSIPLSEFTSVEVETDAHDMKDSKRVSAILIGTQNDGFLEVTPHSRHGGDLLVAYLQASLPAGIIAEDRSLLLVSMRSSMQSDRSLDMQRFEGKAVEKRFLNESFWERMRRRSARVATRLPEFCNCLEAGSFNSLEDELDVTSDNSSCMEDKTVASILTEMELDHGSERVAIEENHMEKLKSEITPNSIQAVV